MTIVGSGNYRYEELPDWPQLPNGWDIGEVVDVAVDRQDRVQREHQPGVALDPVDAVLVVPGKAKAHRAGPS